MTIKAIDPATEADAYFSALVERDEAMRSGALCGDCEHCTRLVEGEEHGAIVESMGAEFAAYAADDGDKNLMAHIVTAGCSRFAWCECWQIAVDTYEPIGDCPKWGDAR